jgi:4-diphosphocytidyl-2-C-methyl-D-erythritol kinase
MVKLLTEAAPAKINLFLRVTGRRADGYHELDSVFVPISLADRVCVEMRPSKAPAVRLRCDSPALPTDDRNLAVRAASALMTEFGIEAEVLIDLHKEIPVGAGLGGGSSDAGAVLRMMAALCRTDESARIARVALTLGADVPFFLDPVPARVGGIGERIAPLASVAQFALVLAVPPVEVSTATIFRELKASHWSGAASDGDIRAIVAGRITSDIVVNDLEAIAIAKYPVIAELKSMLLRVGASAASMTGSGSAVFGIFVSAGDAARAALELRTLRPDVRVIPATPF